MVRGGAEAWEVVTSFCEAVMLAKEEAECVQETANFCLATLPLRPRGHPRRHEGLRPLLERACGRRAGRSSPSHARLKELSLQLEGLMPGKLSARAVGTVLTRYRATEGTGSF